jgi:hypothetical protein
LTPPTIDPVNPLYQGTNSSNSSPLSFLFIYWQISLGLKLGMEVDHPVPIPSAPFIRSKGRTGTNQYGSTEYPSSSKYCNV